MALFNFMLARVDFEYGRVDPVTLKRLPPTVVRTMWYYCDFVGDKSCEGY